jgi:pyruvate,water dikinase
MTFPSLATAGRLDPARFGGKSAHLAGLAARGYAIPSGFAIPVETVLDWQAPLLPQIAAEIAALGRRGEDEVAARIQSLFLSHPLDGPLRAKLGASCAAHLAKGPQTPVAVRSSAVGEDAAEASFAGQFESLLGVRGLAGVEAAVRRVWASLYSPRAIRYRHEAGLPAAASPMGVTVLEMVDAAAAGVGFSVDVVTGKRDRLVIEATHGLAEPLVQGQITPDRFTVDKAELRLMVAHLGDKGLLCQTGPKGQKTRSVQMPDALKACLSLTRSEAEAIAGLLARLEQDMGHPIDIEWALDQRRQISLLQVRPISSALPEAVPVIWDLCGGMGGA